MRRAGAALAALSLLAFAERASANGPAPYSRDTGAVPGLVVERASPVTVEREDLAVDCAKNGATVHPACSFVATYHLVNPTDAEEELVGAFYTLERPSEHGRSDEQEQPARVEVRLDDVDVRADATGEQIERMDAIVSEDPEVRGLRAGPAPMEFARSAFRIVLAGRRRAKLVFAGELRPTRYRDGATRDGYLFPPIATRHPFGTNFGATEWTQSDAEFTYLITPITRWAGDPEVHIQVRHYADTDFVPRTPRRYTRDARRTRDSGKDVVTETAVIRASSRQNLRFELAYDPPLLHPGGPVFGIGPRIGREELRVRLGWEVGLGRSFILGASAETNFDEYVTGAVTIDGATASVLGIIPSLGLGLGVPLQLRQRTDPRVGVRTQITISFAMVSFLFPVDIYPTPNSSGAHGEGAFLTQLSF